MGNSIIERLSSNFTDNTLPRLYRDPVLNPGSQFLFDFTDPFSNPNGDGNLAAGAVFNNMVDGAPGATVTGNTATFASLPNRSGLSVPGASGAAGTANTIDLGTSYSLAASNHDFIATLWLKTPSSGFTTGYPQLLVHGPFSNEGQSQLSITTGSDGKTPRGAVATAAGQNSSAAAASGAGLGAVTQFGLSRVGTTLNAYINGAQVATAQLLANSLYDSSAQSTKMGAAYKGTIYRIYKEDVTVSAAILGTTTAIQAAAAILADYNAKAGAYV